MTIQRHQTEIVYFGETGIGSRPNLSSKDESRADYCVFLGFKNLDGERGFQLFNLRTKRLEHWARFDPTPLTKDLKAMIASVAKGKVIPVLDLNGHFLSRGEVVTDEREVLPGMTNEQGQVVETTGVGLNQTEEVEGVEVMGHGQNQSPLRSVGGSGGAEVMGHGQNQSPLRSVAGIGEPGPANLDSHSNGGGYRDAADDQTQQPRPDNSVRTEYESSGVRKSHRLSEKPQVDYKSLDSDGNKVTSFAGMIQLSPGEYLCTKDFAVMQELGLYAASTQTPLTEHQGMVAEMQKHLAYKSMCPVMPGAVPMGFKPLPSKGFVTKREKNGVLGVKGRFVIGGHRQSKPTTDPASPTLFIQALYLAIQAGLNQGMQMDTHDVECAFLNSELTEEIYCQVDRHVTSILVELEPSWKRFVEPTNQTMTVRLLKAVYGLIQASAEFYKLVSTKLFSFGFTRSPHCRCLFLKNIDGVVMMVVGFVDDFGSIGFPKFLCDFSKQLDSAFVKVNHVCGPHLNYLGLDIEFQKEFVSVKQLNYITQTVQLLNIQPSDVSPAPNNIDLFKLDSESKPLSVNQRDLFRTVAWRVMFISSRCRHDLKLVSGWVSTRLENPTEQDASKLLRVVRFLNSIKTEGLVFRIGPMIIRGVSDSSHLLHPDGRGQAGFWIHCSSPHGCGISAASLIHPKRSTSAAMSEGIAAYITACETVWLGGMAGDVGFPQHGMVLEQDNKSTIRILERGSGWGGKSKIFDVKVFWITEQIELGVLKVLYVEGSLISADGFSKARPMVDFPAWSRVIQGAMPETETQSSSRTVGN
jgi:hypothetical protein